MARNTSISLGSHFESFISQKVASGSYSSRSEVMRSALRLLEERDKSITALQEALIEGEESGFIKNPGLNDHLAKLHKEHL